MAGLSALTLIDLVDRKLLPVEELPPAEELPPVEELPPLEELYAHARH